MMIIMMMMTYFHVATFGTSQAENTGFGEHVKCQWIDAFLVDYEEAL